LCQTTRPDILCVKLLLSLRNVVKDECYNAWRFYNLIRTFSDADSP